MKYTVITISLVALVFVGCLKKENNTQISSFDFINKLKMFNYQDEINHDVSRNSFITNERAQLGRALFYDKSLSLNGKVSCGSCHIQELGFSDGKALSDGFLDQKTPLHSMSLVNIASNTLLFWDGRENNLFKQAILPISNHIEMGLDNESLLLAKIQGNPMYFELFKDAFGDEQISTQRTSIALANFIASLASFNTKFDMVSKEQSYYLELEENGLKLFNEKYNCNSCHGGVNFNSNWGGSELTNIGLDKEDERAFKVPSLRNVMVSAPYMHDGRFKTIDEVLNHYSNGIKDNPKIDWRLSSFTQSNGGMQITTEDKIAIIAFLNTLTDHKLITDAKFSNPY
ncbi:MAG: cytochrome c peroxidase [Bacteroidota bacterium]|nr:cytochrome c peroxidase [Bacteroidota bacterium]